MLMPRENDNHLENKSEAVNNENANENAFLSFIPYAYPFSHSLQSESIFLAQPCWGTRHEQVRKGQRLDPLLTDF